MQSKTLHLKTFVINFVGQVSYTKQIKGELSPLHPKIKSGTEITSPDAQTRMRFMKIRTSVHTININKVRVC